MICKKGLRLLDLYLYRPFSFFVFRYDISDRLIGTDPFFGIGSVDEDFFAGRRRLDKTCAFSFVKKHHRPFVQYKVRFRLRGTAVFVVQHGVRDDRRNAAGRGSTEERPQQQMENKNDFHVC